MIACVRAGLVVSAIALFGCGGDGDSGDRRATPQGGAPAGSRTSDSGGVSGREAGRQARECLRGVDRRLVGGSRSPGDTDAPDFELVVGDKAIIGFYDDADRAAKYEPDVRTSVASIGGSVDRRGRVTVAWPKPPSEELRRRVFACIESE